MKKRGFLLVAVLLLTVVLLVAGLALLTQQSASYGGGRLAISRAQARTLAWAGLEDAMAKLQKDIQFPPSQAMDQDIFSWSEQVTDFETGDSIGSYQVQLSTRYSALPHTTLILVSTGRAGSGDDPEAIRVLRAEVELDTSQSNTYEIVNLIEN